MTQRSATRRWWWPLLLLLGLLPIGQEPSASQGQGPVPIQGPNRWVPPASLYDPRLEPLRRASVSWDLKAGPERAVVDQVCLVPDAVTFFEALATWDAGHWFPILIDDVETTARFLRAFRPARVVRYPKSARPGGKGETWARAVAAVGSTWAEGPGPVVAAPSGGSVPKGLGPTPPGVVVSHPDAPMLAGAAALAAGRFQPLVRLDPGRRFEDRLSAEEFAEFDRALTAAVASAVPNPGGLGDGCDFLTLAGDYPFRYGPSGGEPAAVDDALGRQPGTGQRWAFTGRVLGDATRSVYSAMSSLFLQPESALMFNAYDESAYPWSLYTMREAARRMADLMPTAHVSGPEQATVEGWHEAFDPSNRHGLVLINSSGSSTAFNLRGGMAHSADIPRGVPSAVVMIHSFSAQDPNDPATIAGRWMANGAFLFFGSMYEPYVDAFRTPRLVGDLIGERLPLGAAVRVSLAEPRGTPWRLVYLGDPLYRLRSRTTPTPRVAPQGASAHWPAYAEGPRPAAEAGDEALFSWALKTAIARLGSRAAPPDPSDLADALLAVRRPRLSAPSRAVFDALLIEVLLDAKRRGALRSKLAAMPEATRSPSVRRCYETLLAADLDLAVSRKDPARARSAWAAILDTDAGLDFKERATARVGALADSPSRRAEWAALLRATLREHAGTPEAANLAAALKQAEADR